MNTRWMLAALLLLPCSALAAPEINVGALYDYLESGKSTLVKRVRNGGDTTAFVKVSVVELVYDQNGTPREIAQDSLPMAERGVVASPARLIVPANGMQAVRLLYRGGRDAERYFRVRFVPVLPEAQDGFNLSEAEAEQYREGLKAGVNLLAGYGTLLFVRPDQVLYDTPIDEQPSRLAVGNKGNATVILDRFRHCSRDGQRCETTTKHHLLPGRTREFPRQEGWTYEFELIEGRDRRELAIGG
ncbi:MULTISPECIES: molecular chaperone [unclassified Pseudomonas]|uniref:molecular chaperone n=1 Tax=unclassified Pseudomonas TaxID=196821 RepID=UPI0035C0E726